MGGSAGRYSHGRLRHARSALTIPETLSSADHSASRACKRRAPDE
jgi:hypothetical protein